MRGLAACLWVAALAACAPGPRTDPLMPPGTTRTPVPEATRIIPRSATEAAAAPHIYMALQPDRSGPLSVVFAIDAQRDGTPGDDPAIRLTPEDGKCNPQELRRYDFPAEAAERPVFGPAEVASGITARELPSFMAMAVTHEMMRLGMIEDIEDSKPQNVCARKLWERMIVNESLRPDAS
jgi:hypothetical protein